MADDRVIQIAVSPRTQEFPDEVYLLYLERRGLPRFSVGGRLEMEREGAAGRGRLSSSPTSFR